MQKGREKAVVSAAHRRRDPRKGRGSQTQIAAGEDEGARRFGTTVS
jgi:hypothetical protein